MAGGTGSPERLLTWGLLLLGYCHYGIAVNMNGRYLVASGGRQGVPFNDDYASKGHEYFDVYSPEIATHYGEVFWTDQGNNPLPKKIIQRFNGKVMAITGYEQDQVMVYPPGKPGVNPDQDVSVPINWAYNHHYMAWMTGKYSELVRIPNPDPNNVMAHGSPMVWMAVDKPSAAGERLNKDIPTSQMFSEGNGGESRKSFHGYPDGYAQLIESPNMWHITPMQIDTRNRDCGATPKDIHNCTNHMVPGPEPKQARYGLGMPKGGSPYSGILECPCNSRFGGDPSIYGANTKTKTVTDHYMSVANPSCGNSAIYNAVDCFKAVASLGIRVSANVTISTASNVPQGCVVQADAAGTWKAAFNRFKSSTQCSTSLNRAGNTSFDIGTKLSIELDSTTATITLSGPADVWFGVGFNATAMADQPYTIRANSSGVYEQKIGTCGSEGDHCPGTPLNTSVTIVSSKVVDNIRTVVLKRPLKGMTEDHFTFNVRELSQINMISAVGSSQVFGYHKKHATGVIPLLAGQGPNCVCDMGSTGTLCDDKGKNCETFVKNCVPAPAGELLSQRNPTCNSKQYAGGLKCCKHGRIMLDADQPIRPELLRYHMKFRFWFQEYNASGDTVSHYNLPRIYYQTEAWAGEYDIPPAFATPGKPIPGYPNWPLKTPTPGTTCTGNCPDGKDCECEHTIVYKWQVPDNMRLIYAGGHCHAPACIKMELFYRNYTGQMELLCRQVPVYGKGNVTANKYDEMGYIALPPCLWGNDKGLNPSVLLPANTTLVAIKHNRNTHMGHYGEMASWQMRGVNF